MRTSKQRRALAAALTVFAAAPSIGCVASHTPSAPDAAQSVDGSAAHAPSMPSPSMPSGDASAPLDAMADAVVLADAGTVHTGDAGTGLSLDAGEPEDADVLDAYYYPDGIRG